MSVIVVFKLYGDHRDLHVLTHSFPTRRSSDLAREELPVRRRGRAIPLPGHQDCIRRYSRSEEHTSELQSLMRISYAVFCLKQKTSHRSRLVANIADMC